MSDPGPGGRTRVSAVVLAFGAEPWFERCIHALLGSTGVDVDVVIVDNGCTDGAVGSPARDRWRRDRR